MSTKLLAILILFCTFQLILCNSIDGIRLPSSFLTIKGNTPHGQGIFKETPVDSTIKHTEVCYNDLIVIFEVNHSDSAERQANRKKRNTRVYNIDRDLRENTGIKGSPLERPPSTKAISNTQRAQSQDAIRNLERKTRLNVDKGALSFEREVRKLDTRREIEINSRYNVRKWSVLDDNNAQNLGEEYRLNGYRSDLRNQNSATREAIHERALSAYCEDRKLDTRRITERNNERNSRNNVHERSILDDYSSQNCGEEHRLNGDPSNLRNQNSAKREAIHERALSSYHEDRKLDTRRITERNNIRNSRYNVRERSVLADYTAQNRREEHRLKGYRSDLRNQNSAIREAIHERALSAYHEDRKLDTRRVTERNSRYNARERSVLGDYTAQNHGEEYRLNVNRGDLVNHNRASEGVLIHKIGFSSDSEGRKLNTRQLTERNKERYSRINLRERSEVLNVISVRNREAEMRLNMESSNFRNPIRVFRGVNRETAIYSDREAHQLDMTRVTERNLRNNVREGSPLDVNSAQNRGEGFRLNVERSDLRNLNRAFIGMIRKGAISSDREAHQLDMKRVTESNNEKNFRNNVREVSALGVNSARNRGEDFRLNVERSDFKNHNRVFRGVIRERALLSDREAHQLDMRRATERNNERNSINNVLVRERSSMDFNAARNRGLEMEILLKRERSDLMKAFRETKTFLSLEREVRHYDRRQDKIRKSRNNVRERCVMDGHAAHNREGGILLNFDRSDIRNENRATREIIHEKVLNLDRKTCLTLTGRDTKKVVDISTEGDIDYSLMFSWQYLFYALQGIYVIGIFIQGRTKSSYDYMGWHRLAY